MFNLNKLKITKKKLKQSIKQIDTFNESRQTLIHLIADQLKTLRHIATIESIGSSTRIDGAKLSNQEIEKLLFGLTTQSFKSQNEEHKYIAHPSLPKLAEDILQLVQKQQKITTSDILQETQAPRSTVKKYINMLVDQKYLMRHGQGRNVWYTLIKR